MLRLFRHFCLLPSIAGGWCVYNLCTMDWSDPYLWPVKWGNYLGVFVAFSGVALNMMLLPLETRKEEELRLRKEA